MHVHTCAQTHTHTHTHTHTPLDTHKKAPLDSGTEEKVLENRKVFKEDLK